MTTHNRPEVLTPNPVTEATMPTDHLRKTLPDMPALPSADISDTREVRDAVDHYMDTITDWDNLSRDAETSDPVLWKSIENAFSDARFALYQQVDAHCSHTVARTLLADRKYRQEQRVKRGSHKDSDTFTALLSNFADAVACFREAQKQGGTAENTTPEERRTSQIVRQAEQALDAFLETFYAEETGLKE